MNTKNIRLISGFALAKFLFHFMVLLFAGYGIFRDELYYMACSDHLAWGYVDQPPLSIWILNFHTLVFGDSLISIRILPAITGGLSMFFLGKSVQEMGGGLFSISLACLAYFISPIILAFGSIFSMNCIDLLVWIISYYLVLRLINTENKRIWIWLGIVLGLGLMNKISVLFLGTGLFIALWFPALRKWLKTPWPYAAGIIVLFLFLPYILWNYSLGFPHLEFIENASGNKYGGLSAWTFISGQFLINHPNNFPVYMVGLGFFFFTKKGREYLPVGIIFIVTTLILMLNGHSKSEYLAGALTILFGGGAVLVEQWVGKLKWVKILILAVLGSGIILAPLTSPILSEDSYIKFSRALGISPGNAEGKEEAELHQFYADMHGWEQKAKAVSEAYQSLSEEEKKSTIAVTGNYGRAGCLDYYRDKYPLPPSYSGHNNYWLWGPPENKVTTVILLQSEPGSDEIFESVQEAGHLNCRYCMPYENNLKVYIARNPKQSPAELWDRLKNYD